MCYAYAAHPLHAGVIILIPAVNPIPYLHIFDSEGRGSTPSRYSGGVEI